MQRTNYILIIFGWIAFFHNILASPYYLTCIYDWYLLDLFHEPLTYHNALGLELFSGMLFIMTKKIQKEDFRDVETNWGLMIYIMFSYWIALGIAWLLKGINF